MINAAEAYFLAKFYAEDNLRIRSISRIGAELNNAWVFNPIGARQKDWLISVSKDSGEVSVFSKSENFKQLNAARKFRLSDKDLRDGESPSYRGWVIAIFMLAISLVWIFAIGSRGYGMGDVAAVLLPVVIVIFLPALLWLTRNIK